MRFKRLTSEPMWFNVSRIAPGKYHFASFWASTRREHTQPSFKSSRFGYLRSELSSRYFVHLLRNELPLDTVSESPITHKCRFGRVIATVIAVRTGQTKEQVLDCIYIALHVHR